jgi:CCR4-NOT transcription complex subunit 1
MAVINLLVELYHYAELKLILKCEIEVLCKSLDVDIDTIEATSILRNRQIADSLNPPLPEYVADIDSLPIGGYDPHAHGADSQLVSLGPTSPPDNQRTLDAHIEAILATLPHQIHINPQLTPLHTNIVFKRAVQSAVERAVREVSIKAILVSHKLSCPFRSYCLLLSVP